MPAQRSARRRLKAGTQVDAGALRRSARRKPPPPAPTTDSEGAASRVNDNGKNQDAAESKNCPASLCFVDAHEALTRSDISEDDYLAAITAHCTGVRHGRNRLCNNDATRDAGVFAGNVTWAAHGRFLWGIAEWVDTEFFMPQRSIEDDTPVKNMLHAYIKGDDRSLRRGFARLDKLFPGDSHADTSRSLSRTLGVTLAVAAMHDNKDAIVRAAASDQDRCTDIQQNLDFQRVYQESRDKGINSEAVRAVDAVGLHWYDMDKKFNLDLWLDDHR